MKGNKGDKPKFSPKDSYGNTEQHYSGRKAYEDTAAGRFSEHPKGAGTSKPKKDQSRLDMGPKKSKQKDDF